MTIINAGYSNIYNSNRSAKPNFSAQLTITDDASKKFRKVFNNISPKVKGEIDFDTYIKKLQKGFQILTQKKDDKFELSQAFFPDNLSLKYIDDYGKSYELNWDSGIKDDINMRKKLLPNPKKDLGEPGAWALRNILNHIGDIFMLNGLDHSFYHKSLIGLERVLPAYIDNIPVIEVKHLIKK